jgi:hypothetical protein
METLNLDEAGRLTQEQTHALVDYVKKHGRRWKDQLRDDWMRARCSPPLQQLRNRGGPSWLETVKVNTLERSVSHAGLPR